jgi:EAL domain-containing protein (putative c-di-GMP-specific phosphodiesterase class I)
VQDSAKAIIRAVIGLGHSMNLTVTAEGVESESQLQYLEDERCDMIQGYLIGRPSPIVSVSTLTGNVEKKSAFVCRSDGQLKRAGLVANGFDCVP